MKSKVTYRPHRVVSLNGRIFAQLYDGPFDVAENFARLNWGLDVHLTNWSALSDTVRAEALKTPEFSCLAQMGAQVCGNAMEVGGVR
jgi:hypothetical protein